MVRRIEKHAWAMLALLVLPSCQSVPPPGNAAAIIPLNHLPALAGDYFRIDSKAVGRGYHIYVRYPETYAKEPDRKYPIVYLTDGDSAFPMLAANHLFLNYDEGLPDAIVVGIAYGSFDPAVNRRDVDFTPPDPAVAPAKAGASAFQQFVKNELIPLVERRYRADPGRRVLVGQGRGGTFVLYSAFTDPDLFWGRIAINPPLWRGRDLFFGKPASGMRNDLGLVVTSGSRDRPPIRADVTHWFRTWEGRKDKPWSLYTVTIEGATHAANMTDAYRAGMLWLFHSELQAKRQ